MQKLCCTLAGFATTDRVHLSFVFVISDKKAACFALGGALKARAFWTLLKCEMECCTDSNCNNQTPTLTQAAITVFTPDGNTKHLNFSNKLDHWKSDYLKRDFKKLETCDF